MTDSDTIMDPLFYKIFRALSTAAFAISLVIHAFSLFGIAVLSPLSLVFSCLFMVSAWFSAILQYKDPQIWRLVSSNFLFHPWARDYRKAVEVFWYEYFPLWAKIVSGGLLAYFFIQIVLFSQINPVDARDYGSAASLRYSSSFLLAAYWPFIWMWHTQVVRLEKSLAAPTDMPQPPQ